MDKPLNQSFIESVFQRRECARFIPSARDHKKCGCGRTFAQHTYFPEPLADSESDRGQRWTISKHTIVFPTDAYGTIEFQGGPHPHKASYVKLGFDSEPDQILHLFETIWNVERPKLVISVHGGMANFNLQQKLARAFRKGLLKAAKTTGAWIITSGLNTGVVRYVAMALSDGGGVRTKRKVLTIGIAPWGLLKKREDFVGRDAFSPRGRFAVLNDKHSYFLLVDNGTLGRYGADIILRKRFEEFLSKQALESDGKRIPVVSVVLEGGTCTIRSVLDYVTNIPPVPVVVCDGSGRAADLISFAHKMDDRLGEDNVVQQLIETIKITFDYNEDQAMKLVNELAMCIRNKHLITIFRLGEDNNQDIDHAILTALLKGQNLSAPDQLSLALTWNRVDIARSDIFVYGQEWPPRSLEIAMMEALVNDRVDFVKLLLEHGVSMQKFLTIERLEELYNTDKGPPYSVEALQLLIKECVKYAIPLNHQYTLYEIGLVVERLMGGGFRANYCTKKFKQKYNRLSKRTKLQNIVNQVKLPLVYSKASFSPNSPQLCDETDEDIGLPDEQETEPVFDYPFNELLLWAVLMRRQKMALCMWQHGEEALAKALVACRLYKAMSKEAADDYLEVEICEELKQYSEEFRKLAIELLEQCYSDDDDLTFQLLTYELQNWGKQTCISLAVSANHKEFLAHPCCQILLADLWHGGMRMRKHPNLRVLLGLAFFPSILTLEFKTKDELLLQPQTREEHQDLNLRSEDARESVDLEEDQPDAEGGSVASSRESSDTEDANTINRRRRTKSTASRSSVTTPHPAYLPSKQLPRQHSRSTERLKSIPACQQQISHISGKVYLPQQLTTPNLDFEASSPGVEFRSWIQFERSYNRKIPLRTAKKFYEFYVAPITTFWSFTISYLAFLVVFTYVLLVKTEPGYLSWPEIFVVCWIISYGFELLRKLFMTDTKKFSQKLKVFSERHWNIWSSTAVVTFVIALCLRTSPHTNLMMTGRVMYNIDIVYWFLKLLDILSVSKEYGPLITMVGKMTMNMIHVTTILFIVTMSFGVTRQSILFPYNDFHWQLVRDIFYKPYFMLYGEVYAAEIDTCGDEGKDCVPGGWLTPAFMAAFLLIANILLLNLLIATFNNIFQEVNSISHQVWKFQRYSVVMEYEQMPCLPPPFILISHLYLLAKYLFRCFQGRRFHLDNALKLFLNKNAVEKLHDFEEGCMEDYFRQRDLKNIMSTEERIRRTNDRVEFLGMKLDDIAQKQNLSKLAIQAIDRRLDKFEELLKYTLRSGGLAVPSDEMLLQPATPSAQIVLNEIQNGFTNKDYYTTSPVSPKTPATSHFIAGPDDYASANSAAPKIIMRDRPGRRSRSTTPIPASSPSFSEKSGFSNVDAVEPTSPARVTFYLASSTTKVQAVSDATTSDNVKPVSPSPVVLVSETQSPLANVSFPSPTIVPGTARALLKSVSIEPRTTELRSCPASLRRSSLTPSGTSTSPVLRRQRNAEYTSITDCIETEDIPPPTVSSNNALLTTVSADAGLKNARWSFVVGENQLLKQFEEVGSVITASLLHDRLRQEANSMCADQLDELRDMGMGDLELQDYANVLRKRSHASSHDSISSAKLEDDEGFRQINEFLVNRQQPPEQHDEQNTNKKRAKALASKTDETGLKTESPEVLRMPSTGNSVSPARASSSCGNNETNALLSTNHSSA